MARLGVNNIPQNNTPWHETLPQIPKYCKFLIIPPHRAQNQGGEYQPGRHFLGSLTRKAPHGNIQYETTRHYCIKFTHKCKIQVEKNRIIFAKNGRFGNFNGKKFSFLPLETFVSRLFSLRPRPLGGGYQTGGQKSGQNHGGIINQGKI